MWRSSIGSFGARSARARAITERPSFDRSPDGAGASPRNPGRPYPDFASLHPGYFAGAAPAACGRIMAQPTRESGSRPRTGRAKERGPSTTRAGKRDLIAAGGAPVLSLTSHTRIAPFSRTSGSLTHGVSSGVAARYRLGAAGGAPGLWLPSHTRIAPFSRTSGSLTHGVSSGVAARYRLGRSGDAMATSPAPSASPATMRRGAPGRR